MNKNNLKKLFDSIYSKSVTPAQAMETFKMLPFENMDFAHIDHHREIRQGFPEVIYCEGKTISQIIKIAGSILKNSKELLATRADKKVYLAIKKKHPKVKYNALARMVFLKKPKKITQGKILVMTAGTADIPIAEEAVLTAEILGNKVEKTYDVGVAGLHRLLDKKALLAEARVIIVVAGMEGALASVVGGLVDKPVIGVPTSTGYGASFKGIAALLTMLNSCAAGVATVNIDNGFGAGYLAHKINLLGEK